jgi:hypothetical protein
MPKYEFDVFALFRRDDWTTGFSDRVGGKLALALNSRLCEYGSGCYGVEFVYDDGLSRFKLRYPWKKKYGKLNRFTRSWPDDPAEFQSRSMVVTTFKYETRAQMRKALPKEIVTMLERLDKASLAIEGV